MTFVTPCFVNVAFVANVAVAISTNRLSHHL